MASLTKMMTLFVASEIIQANKIDIHNTIVEISYYAASVIGASAKLIHGD